MDWEITLKIFVEYVVPFLISETFVDCCSFDVVWEIVVCTSLDELGLKGCSGSAGGSHVGERLDLV